MKQILLGAILTLTLASTAQAQGYASVGAGITHLNDDCSGTTSCDNSGTGFKLIGGYKFSPNVAAELTYFDFGKATATINFPPIVNGAIKTKGFGIGAALSTDFSPELYGNARLGLATLKTEVSLSSAVASASESQSSTKLYLGFGAGYHVTKQLSLDVSADFSKAKFDGTEEGVRLLSVGATFRF